MSYKLLKVIFVILILVVIGEGGYYFYVLRTNTNGQPSINKQVVISPQVPQQKPTIQAGLGNGNFEPAIHPEMYDYFKKIIKDKNKEGSLYLMIEDKGVLTDIDKDGSLVGESLFPLGLKIKTTNGDNWSYIAKQLFDRIKIYIEKEGIMNTASLDDLVIGDTIITQELLDIYYSPSDERHSKALIIRIQR